MNIMEWNWRDLNFYLCSLQKETEVSENLKKIRDQQHETSYEQIHFTRGSVSAPIESLHMPSKREANKFLQVHKQDLSKSPHRIHSP